MEQRTYDQSPEKVRGFIDMLLSFDIPLAQINTNDLKTSTMPRIYVTRCYGRNKGGRSMAASVRNQMTSYYAFKMAYFYNAENPRCRGHK